ncbi:MAG: hypothetical protein H7835_05710 [Magnetococcus sp. XQGC-1]
MSESLICLDPLTRIIDFHFGWSWRLRIVRDDGWLYAPDDAEKLTIQLYTEEGEWLFTGHASGPEREALPYAAVASGLVGSFLYENESYTVSFNSSVMQLFLPTAGENPRCRLVTAGTNTLQTFFPRGYLAGDTGQLLPPGAWEVTIPLWSVTTVESHPDRMTVAKTTTVRSSIPYQVTYTLREADTLGYFFLPVVGVVWRAAADLSGWVGGVQVDNICQQGPSVIPWQPAYAPAPDTPPTTPGERLFALHYNLKLLVGLGPCPGQWPGMVIAVTSNFGYQGSIPFAGHPAMALNADYPLGAQPATLQGREYARQYQLLPWNHPSFLYDTGEGAARLLRQTATWVQGPLPYFEQCQIQPLPERSV